MRVEVACNRLISASLDRNVKAGDLAKTIKDALEKVKEQSPQGEEALDLLHDGFLREALKRDVNVHKLMALKNEAASNKKTSKASKTVAKKKSAARKVAAKATPKARSKTKAAKSKARPKGNASEHRAAA